MPFQLKELIQKRFGEQLPLHEKYINPQFARVLKTIGFDKLFVKAKGSYFYDKEGREYLDFLSGYGSFNVGRNHPVVAKALHDAIDLELPNMIQMGVTLLPGLLAEKILSYAPENLKKVFFTNSGTESVEGALKFAKAYTGRNKIIHLDHSFHGLSIASLSVNGNEEFKKGFGRLLEPVEKIAMGDLQGLENHLSQKDVAAFIFEPVQGKGVYFDDSNFYLQAQKLCQKYGTLLIADEIQSGLGRTGRFFAFQHWNLEPDIVTLAKSLSGGYVPVGAILMKDEIYKSVYTKMERCVVHSSTFGKNDLAMVCGLATLAVIEEEKLIQNAYQMGNYLLEKLTALKAKYEMLHAVRGKGLMICLEFGKPSSLKLKMGWNLIHKASKDLFAQMIVVPLFRDYRILTQVPGHHMDAVKILPPLTMSQKEADYFITAFDAVLAACHQFPGSAWDVGYTLAKQALKAKGASQAELVEYEA